MASQHPTGSQQPSSSHLDAHLKGIRDEFDRLHHELDETRNQRDKYITKFMNKAKELRELRQTISRACGFTITDDDPPLISPASSSSECLEGQALCHPENSKEIGSLEGERNREGDDIRERGDVQSTAAGIASLSLESNETSTNKPGHSAWDVELLSDRNTALNLNLVHKLTTHKGRTYVSFSMDGKYLATASHLGIVTIFDSKTGKRISVMKDLYHDKESLPMYQCLGFSPDSKYLATGESDGKVRIWIISQRRVRNIFKSGWEVRALNFSPNGQWIATSSRAGMYTVTVRLWRLRDGFSRVLDCAPFYPWSVRFSPDGRFIASGCDDTLPAILMWKVRTGELVEWSGHSDIVASLVFTPDGNGLLSASMDGTVIHWDTSSLRLLTMANPLSSGIKEISRLSGHTFYIQTISISPDGKWIASGSWDKTVRIWNAHDDALYCILHCPGEVWSVDFSPVGNYLAIGGLSDEVTIWDYTSL